MTKGGLQKSEEILGIIAQLGEHKNEDLGASVQVTLIPLLLLYNKFNV